MGKNAPEFHERMQDEFIRSAVVNDVQSEIARGVPARYQQSMEELAQVNANRLKDYRRAISRRGGAARRSDVLTRIITEIVRRDPRTSVPQMLDKLSSLASVCDGPICDVTEEYVGVQLANGQIKNVPITGLKDRVSRARKSLRLSKIVTSGSMRKESR